MGHTLRDDELAIVIRPQNYEEDWNGDCSIELVSSKDNPVPNVVMAHIMNVATMMSAFLDVASEHPDVYDLVENIVTISWALTMKKKSLRLHVKVMYIH